VRPHGERSSGGEEQQREEAARKLPQADRVAYYQLATASGALRVAAVGRSADGLRAVLLRLDELRPLDGELRWALARLRSAFRTFLRDSNLGKAALAATDAVNRRLARYVRRHAPAGVLVPD
jgi:hypothetical protein